MHIRRYDSGGCATNYVDFGIYSANIQVNEKEESQEQATGIYIKKGEMVQAKIGPSMLEMGSPEFVEMAEPQQINFKIEAIEGSSKISLWEYDPSTGSYTSRSFPYTYSCTPDPGTPFLSKTLYLKGEDTSSQVGDIKLTLKGYKISEDDSIAIDTVVITVFNIGIDADHTSICAGGDDLNICKTYVHVFTTPSGISGLPVSFSLVSKVTDNADGTIYTNVATSPGTVSPTSIITDAVGTETVIYISGTNASSDPDTGLLLDIGIKAIYEGTDCDTRWIRLNPPQETLEIFLDPIKGRPLNELVASETQVLNTLTVTYNNVPIAGHSISWKFRFWTWKTLDDAALTEYGLFFDQLDIDQQEYIFSHYGPDYEGTGPSDFGEIEPNSTTDSSGIARAIYTIGVEGGYIEINAADHHILVFQP